MPHSKNNGLGSESWETIECERVLYVDRGKNVILCDRLPSPVTLVVKRARSHKQENDRG